MDVIKRNNEIVPFNNDNITNAILKAMEETEKGVDFPLAMRISCTIYDTCFDEELTPTVDEIQDMVEATLSVEGRFDVAKRYILYRNERDKIREQGWVMTELQRDIYQQKYRLGDEDFDEFLERVSGGNQEIKKYIRDKKFLPAGRILAGRGLSEFGKKVTLSNCYVMPKVDDTIESIFDTAKWLARTYSYGGGCGLSISNLRPKGARVQNSAQSTTGATSFMDLYSMVTGLIGQKGRRGALMLNIDVNHPDIEEFIDIKNGDSNKVRFANISVNMTHEFMEAVRDNTDFKLHFYVKSTNETIEKVVQARDLFMKLARNNWNMAEPGILFWDNITKWHIMSEDDEFEFAGVNPCAEETLPAFGSCNLSSINLSEFVRNPFSENAKFDFEEFNKVVQAGVVYLNEVLDENMYSHPLPQQTEVSRDLRQIGLGIFGLADMFIKMGITYGSQESIDISKEIARFMLNSALQQSSLLAKEFGTFPKYNEDAIFNSPFILKNSSEETLRMIASYGLRNSQLLTIPPTGSISTLVGSSGGIEPIFQKSYIRKSETLHDEDTYYRVFTPIVKEYMELNNITNEDDLPEYFVTSSDLHYRNRIDVQSAWQGFIDASISSTVNLPNETTVEEVADLYMYAWERGLKGITVYRDGCSRSGILITESKKVEVEEVEECGT